ncbi:MAG: tetratricopeptide repeat protein [Phenylobacterium sp.]|uniref:tetratricopeptide repeat protein n=1 Tax=Phenylobacterium sp. TaxID=1871053 RepID=UPI00301950C4
MTRAGVDALLGQALKHLDAFRTEAAADLARQALAQDRASGGAWRILALAAETSGDLTGALSAYEGALALDPEDAALLKGLARIALDLGMAPVADAFSRRALARNPEDAEAVCLLSRALTGQGQGDGAVEVLSAHLTERPESPEVWNALGLLIADRGDLASAQTFFDEALRLAPSLTPARFNAANLLMTRGETVKALAALERIPQTGLSPRDRATLVFSRACARLRLGDLSGGWRDYAVRNDPGFPGSANFDIPGRRWRAGEALKGEDLLLVGEQGLGDEVMFAGLIPELLDGPHAPASLALAVEPRLVSLFQRSFPGVPVTSHATRETGGRKVRRLSTPSNEGEPTAAWAPMADLLPDLRPSVSTFPDRERFLEADPGQVRAWREWLATEPPGLRVGLLWKSGLMSGSRNNAFAPFETWAPVLGIPGVTFVNLQYGDCDGEIAFARDALGVEIRTPEGLDLKQDLEGVSALSSALDLVIGVSNASFNLAAACGAPAWLITAPDAWTTLGAATYPWYPRVRMFASQTFGDWETVFQSVADALAERVAG